MRRGVLLVLFFLVGWGAEIASRRPPDWITEDPIDHPFGMRIPQAADSVETGGEGCGPGLVTSDQPLDINRATTKQLVALPGVGPVLAGRIVALRDSLHGFHRREELLAVKGVGKHTLQRLSPLIILH